MSSLRALKAGDAFETERKLQRRYDEEEKLGTQQRIMEWINTVLAGEVHPCTDMDWKSIQNHLRDGVILCKLVNKLMISDNMPKIRYRARVNSGFVAMSNFENFLDGAKRYGVNEMSLFEPSDVYEGRKGPLINAIFCLNQLGKLANEKGFQPRYYIPEPRKADWAIDDGADD